MFVKTKEIQSSSKGENDMIDITSQTTVAIKDARIQDGIAKVFV